MVWAFAEEKRYELHVLDIVEHAILRPYRANANSLQNAWGSLLNFLDKTNASVVALTREEAKANLKEANDRINKLMAKRRAQWLAKKSSTGD